MSPCIHYTLSPPLSFTHGQARGTLPYGPIRKELRKFVTDFVDQFSFDIDIQSIALDEEMKLKLHYLAEFAAKHPYTGKSLHLDMLDRPVN